MERLTFATAQVRFFSVRLICALCLLWIVAPTARGQQDTFSTLGDHATIAPAPSEMGFIENANGSLHFEIPLGTMAQRHGGKPLEMRLIYDSALVWQDEYVWYGNSNGVYQELTWGPSPMSSFIVPGWQVSPLPTVDSPPSSIGFYTYIVGTYSCFVTVNFSWTDFEGSTHFFPITTQNGTNGGCSSITSGDALASDSSGYHMYVTNYSDATVFAPDGTLVINYNNVTSPLPGALEDTNGNYFTDTSGGKDTLGRSLPLQDFATSSSDSLVIPSAIGSMTYSVTNASINVKTAFGQQGVVEYSGTMQVIQSVNLPDGTSYQFKYDCDQATSSACGSPSGQSAYYGMLVSLTLPTGGQISYTYTNYSDPYSSIHRWLNSRTSAGGTWSYTPTVLSTCTNSQVGCQQQVKVVKPSGDYTVTTFTLNNSAWPTLMQSYNSANNLLSTVTDTWDFSQACVLYSCVGASYVRKLSEKVTMPVPGSSGNISKQTTYSYSASNPNGIQTGSVSAVNEWAYYSGSSPSFPATPDRATYVNYVASSPTTFAPETVYRPSSTAVCNNTGSDAACPGGGTRVSQKLVTYDGYGVADACGRTPTLSATTPVTGIVNHDDTYYGIGTTGRGNPTTIQDWVSGSSYLCTEYSYDTTGQMTQQVDSSGKITNYAYTDNFFVDSGMTTPPTAFSAPKPTNAYLTTMTVNGAITYNETYGYYYGDGKQAEYHSLNGDLSHYHFDVLDRPASDIFPIGWKLYSYVGATEIDTYTAVGDVSPSTGCNSCTHEQALFDNWGRQISQRLVNNPAGILRTDTNYDTNGRVSEVSHPYISPTAPVYEVFAYDGLDRVTSTTHPDNQVVQTFFGPSVATSGGISNQQGSTTTYGFGYPVMDVDEAGKTKQQWLDGFGRVIEVDEPVNVPGTPGAGSASTSGTEQVNSGTAATGWVTVFGSDQRKTIRCRTGGNETFYDYGTVTLTVNGVSVQVLYGSGGESPDTATSVAGKLVTAANANTNFPATATQSGATINLTAKQTGSQTDYSLSIAAATQDPSDFPHGSWTFTESGSTLTGGTGGTGAYDTGSVWVTVNGFQSSASYGQGSTASSVASTIANGFNSNGSSPVSAVLNGTTITLTSKTSGSTTNYSLSAGSSTSQPGTFSQPSFTASVSGSALTGGTSPSIGMMYTAYQSNPLGDLTKVVQGVQTRTWAYDGLSRVTQETTPEAGTITQSYFASGTTPCSGIPSNVCQRTDARSIVTTYSYNDPLNRLTGKSYNPNTTPSVGYTYDQGGAAAHAIGELTQITDGTGSESDTYNAMGWITQIAKVIGSTTYTTGYQYNPGGEVTQITYPSGHIVQQAYDVVGELCEVAPQTTGCNTSSSPYTTNYGYVPTQITYRYGNGVTANIGFSSDRSQLASLTYAQGTQTFFNLNYYYKTDSTNCPSAISGNNGQIQCIKDGVQPGRSAAYSYDLLHHLASALTTGSSAYPQWGLSWAYDRYGNRQSETLTAGSGPSNSIAPNPATNQPQGYTFDASGNMTAEPISPPNNYAYDAEDRMTSVTGNFAATYAYDGGNSRVEKIVQGGTTTVYVFSGPAVIDEYDNGAAVTAPSREYIYAGNKLVATLSGGATTYHLADHLSVRMSTDGTTGSPTYGQVVGEQGHYPYGEVWYTANTTTKKFFTSYERDGESGLDYALARYYDSRVGSFCSADPIEGSPSDPQTWNRYLYGRDEPIDMVDPSGKGFWSTLFNIIFDIFTFGSMANAPPMPGTPPFSGLESPWNPLDQGNLGGLVISENGSLGSNFASTQAPTSGVYCNPGVLDAMQAAWNKQQPANMMKGHNPVNGEAGFPVYSSSDSSDGGFTAGGIQQGSPKGFIISGTSKPVAVFHTHPPGSTGLPSTPDNTAGDNPNEADTASAVDSGVDIYVISENGLSRAPSYGPRNPKYGKGNSPWIIRGNTIGDWLPKLRQRCSQNAGPGDY